MGNRTSATANGQTSTYYQGTGGSGSSGGNALNQYGSPGVPRVLDIAGLADSSATVTVNSQSTQREGEHWFKQLALSGNAAQWQSVAVSISGGGGTSGSVLLKEHPEVYAYDDDGNLSSDGRWTYAWDADGARQRGDGAPKARPKGRGGRVPFGRTTRQNRLKRMETVSSAYTGGAPRKRIDYAHDDRGRRTLKSVYTWNTSTSAFNTTPTVKVGFLYHDWNLLQEVDLSASSPATLRSYYWGLDLSGTLQGAGGVGGLLAADLDAASYSTAFYASDANGNVSDLAWALGGFAAHYEYDAFGNAFPENTGWLNLASLNPFRFSTKYTETDAASGGNETGLLYYGLRYYNPSTGRWPSRDPIEENGGLNLYGMVGNDPINFMDPFGLATFSLDESTCTLNVVMRWKVRSEGVGWTRDSIASWKYKAEKLIENYFSNLDFKCMPIGEGCKCPGGVKVKFDLQMVDFSEDFLVIVYPGHGGNEVIQNAKRATMHQDAVEEAEHGAKPGQIGPDNPVTHTQYPVVHEAGHMMSLNHPGTGNNSENYYQDAASLMGVGMILRKNDFNKAFCKPLKKKLKTDYEWVASAPPQPDSSE